jgi:long-subunit fatty acid transport protein
MYTETKIHPDNMSIEAPELDGHSVGGGVAWSPADRWSLNAGLMKTFYQDETTTNGIKLEKSLWIMALGIQYKFF